MDHLLTAIAAGELHAVDSCLRRYSGAVWSLARRFSPTEQDAEDAVQEVFLDLWKSAGRFDPSKGSEITFVMTLTRRRLIDRGRRLRGTPQPSLIEPETLPDEPTVDEAELADDAALAHQALEQLRPEQRQVLQMSLVQGHTHQQVAERTGMPLGTVKSHARRGLMRVREMLGVEPEPDPAAGGRR